MDGSFLLLKRLDIWRLVLVDLDEIVLVLLEITWNEVIGAIHKFVKLRDRLVMHNIFIFEDMIVSKKAAYKYVICV